MVPELSRQAWALLEALHRAVSGGPAATQGFQVAYDELRTHGLVRKVTITDKGETALRARFLSDDKGSA